MYIYRDRFRLTAWPAFSLSCAALYLWSGSLKGNLLMMRRNHHFVTTEGRRHKVFLSRPSSGIPNSSLLRCLIYLLSNGFSFYRNISYFSAAIVLAVCNAPDIAHILRGSHACYAAALFRYVMLFCYVASLCFVALCCSCVDQRWALKASSWVA